MKKLFSPAWNLIVFTIAMLYAALRLRPARPCYPFAADPLACGDVYGANATKIRTSPPIKVHVTDMGARIRYLNEVYTQSGAGTIGDVIHVQGLPVGAKVLAHLCQLTNSAGVANATLAVGKTGAATALLAATAVENAGTRALTPPANGADDVTIAEGEELIITNATAALIANQVVRLRVAYVENS